MMKRELAVALLGVWCACGAVAAESSVEKGLQQAMIWSPSASPGQQAYVGVSQELCTARGARLSDAPHFCRLALHALGKWELRPARAVSL